MALTQVKATALADSAVTTAKLADDAVTGAKIADDTVAEANMANDAISLAELKAGTDGQVITYDASGNPTAVGPGTDGQVLTSTGAGSPPAFETLPTSGATLSGSTDNTIVTVTGANAMQGEANLTYDGSDLNVTGNINPTGHLDMPDAKYVKLGTGDDFQLGHDTTNYINNWADLQIRNETSEVMIDCNRNGSVELFHDGTKQCETSANGLAMADGKGIDFAADGQAGGMTSELLDDYEEGTFTADVIHQGSTSNTGHYVKIGRLVIANFRLTTLTATGNVNHQAIGGLPFTIKNVTSAGGGARSYQTYNVGVYDCSPNSTAAYMYTNTGGNISAVNVGNKILTGSIIYITDS
tara:strand:+ start:493 stop:1554 length:1062 start_codon:yes stop_codon:yes gene_type:complete